MTNLVEYVHRILKFYFIWTPIHFSILFQGQYEYKFIVDGRWVCNPDEPMKDDEKGGKNNTISVKESDFEVFDALDMDHKDVNTRKRKGQR